MKRSYLILKSGDLRGYSFSRRSPLLKAASLGTAMAALLSSVAPVVASNFSPTEQQTTIQSSQSLKGTGVTSLKAPEKASKKSRDSVFASDRYCGIDNIVVPNSSDSKKIISEESYVNLLTHHKFDNWCSRGFGVQQATWTVDGKNTVLDVYETRVLRDDTLGTLLPNSMGVMIGENARVMPRSNSIAIGYNTHVTMNNSVALGTGSTASLVVQRGGYDAWKDGSSDKEDHIWRFNHGIVSIAAPTAARPTSRLLTGVAAGIQDTDAVNVAQLQALRQWTAKIANDVSTHLGGGADILSGVAPTYKIQGSNHRDVGSAFKGVDGSITDLYSKIANGAGDSLVQQEKGNGRITIGSKVGGTAIDLTNKEGKGRTLSGLADGKLSDSSTEAVTGKQLYDVDTKLTKTTQDVTKVRGDITKIQGDVTKVQGDVTKVQGDVSTIVKNASAYLGGGADILSGVAPTYKIQGSNHRDVGSAFVGVDGSITDLYSKIANVAGDSLVQQEKGNGRITIGSKVGGTAIDLTNKEGKGRTLSGLADGQLSDSSTEAVTGKQLYDVDTKLTKTTQDVTKVQGDITKIQGDVTKVQGDVTKVQGDVSTIAKNASAYLGGGADILGGKAPTYKIQGSNHHDVGSAFAGVDGSISDLYSKIASVAGDSLVQQEQEESSNGRITIGSKVGGTAIDLTNKEGKGRTLSGLADGKLSDSSTEAVTGKQLYDVDTKLTKTTQDVTKVQGDITKIQGDVTKVQGDVTKVQGDVSTIAKNASAYLGGGADILGGKAPTYKIQGSNHHDVGSAFAGVDGSISDLYSKIASVAGDSLVQQEQEESSNGRITIGSKVGGTAIDLTNKEGKGRTLSGLADGQLSDSSTEAVTGKQLYDVDTKLTKTTQDVTKVQGDITKIQGDVTKVQGDVSTIAKNASAYLGGGADILGGKAPTYKIQGSNHHDVGSAFAGVDGSITDIYSKIASVAGGSLVEQEQEESSNGRITIGSKVGGTEVNFTNKDGEGRTLSGLKDGKLSDSSTEAVTGKQLYEVDTKLTKTTQDVTKVQGEVSTIAKNASTYLGGGADILGGEAPTYKVQGNDYNNVGLAFAGVDSSLSDIYKELSGSGSKSLVQQEEGESGRITIGSKTGGTEINLLNNQSVARVLSGLGDGAISEGSNQAVTGNQLYETNTKLAAYLGGGASYEDGQWADPTFTINVLQEDGSTEEKEYKNVAAALKDISSSFTTVVETNLIQQEESEDESGRITIGANTGGTEVNLTNKDGEGRTLSGLKDGELSDSSTEAVTGKQLYEVDTKLTETTRKVTKVQGDVTKVQGEVSTIAKNASAYLGGGADILSGEAPTYKVQNTEHHDVGSAFAGVDGSITDIYSKIASVAGGSLVEQEQEESGNGRITIGSKVGGTEVNLLNNQSVARVLSGLGDGAISEGSNQAVTGNQLYLTNKKVSEYLGGGAGYEDGEWVDPTFTINVLQEDGSTEEKEYKNVAAALKDISSSFTTVVETNLIQQEESEDESGRITIGAKTGGTEINLTNQDGEGRILSGLKDGELSDSSTEAVTGKQLYEVDSKLTKTTQDVTKVQGDVTKVQGEVSTIARNASAYLGGGADILSGEAPTYKVQNTEHHDVGSAFAGVDGSISDLYSKIAGVAGGSLVEQEQEESSNGRITIGSKVGGTEVNFTNKDGEGRTLSGLKDGQLSDSSTEAVTGKQLYEVDTKLTEKVSDVSKNVADLSTSMDKVQGDVTTIARNASAYLGGGADILGGIAPSYKVQGSDYGNVGAAFAGVDSSLSDIYKELSGSGSKSLVQQEEGESGRITIGSKVGGTEINLLNNQSVARVLSGLGNGAISEGSNQAVTGNQLYETNTKLAAYLGGGASYEDGQWADPTFTINVLQEDGSTEEKEYKNVAAALKDISSSFTTVVETNLIQQEESEDESSRITIGANTGGTEVNLTNKDGEGRTLSGLKDGELSDSSTEAVTGKQLYEVDTKLTKQVSDVSKNIADLSTSMTQVQGDVTKIQGDVSTIANNTSKYLGGGSNILGGEAPTYKVQNTEHHDVGSAFAGVDGSITDLYSKIASVAGGSLVEQEQEESDNGRILIGSKVGGTAIDLTNKDGEGRTLSGLKDGTLSDSSTEAVTGKQLYEVDNKLTKTTQDVTKVQDDAKKIAKNASSYLGGGADILGGIAPSYKVQGSDYGNVGAAFAGVDSSLSDIYKELSGSGSKSLVQQEEGENDRITIGAKTGGTEISLLNNQSVARVLSGLGDGAISEGSNQAVTGNQLYETNTKLAAYLGGGASYEDGQWADPTFTINVLQEDGSMGEEKYTNVAAALKDISNSFTTVVETNLIQQEESEDESGRITIGAKTGGTEINLTNKDGEVRTLSGLKDGELSDSSTEAVTGKQLYEVDTKLTKQVSDVSKNVADLSTSMTQVQGDVTKIQGDVSTIANNTSKYLGGGADVLGGIAPSYKVQGSDYSNVGEAFAGIDTTLTTIQQNITENTENVAQNSLLWSDSEQAFVARHGEKGQEKNSKLRFLLGGDIAADSTEAITGAQLYETNTKLAAYLGGGASYEDGQWADPTFTINVLQEDGSMGEEKYTNVAAALKDISSSFTTVVETNLIQQEESEDESGRITIGAKTGGTEINLTNKDGEVRTLSGLKDADLSDSSTEAVTGKQLYEVDSNLKETKETVSNLSTSMDKVQGDVSTIANNTSKYLGGGADILGGIAPSYKVQGNDYSNVGEAFAGVDSSLSDIYKELSGSGSKSLVQQEKSEDGSGRIAIGAKTGGTEISLLNNQSVARVLSGLGDGAISEGSNHAVTGNQLYLTNKKVSEYFGGGAGYEDGKWVDPTFTINVLQEDGSTEKKEYKNVADALENISSSFTTALETNLIQQEKSEDESGRITIGANIGGTEVNLTNKDGEGRTLSGLKDGTLSASSTEAVTGAQLYKTNTRFDEANMQLAKYLGGGAEYKDGVWTGPTFNIVQFNFGGKDGGPEDKEYKSVASAFDGVNEGLKNLNNRLDDVKNQVEQTKDDTIKWDENKGAYDASRKNKDGKMESTTITGVKDGDVSFGSTEAVNGGQLWDTNQRVDKLENEFDKFQNETNQKAEGAVQYDKDKDGKKTNKVTLVGGDASAPVVIDNVGDGKVEKDSKEAINGGQLYEKMAIVLDDSKKYTDEKVQEAKDYTDMKFESLNYNIEGVKKEARQAAAIGLAAANLRYEDAPGALSVAFSSGSWHSQSAIAFGAGYTSESGDIRSNFSVTTAGGHWGIGAGISVRLK
ncbi:Head domain of trimeric autotransporter adhesin [Bartonella sp. CDC_skunk]|uniref:YadA-like family protein n=1 Tax=Bartonella sp. CDC_skunk TaxID=1933905 RepID=UPI00099966E0|nr:YadA-like family protein [Bartonella sp. CDC_skunk]AQX20942.1 Head domain of trimeric autotransporter adhesin [Bartonella sp. CDC_skunk]